MTIKHFQDMPFWILSALAFGLQMDTLYRAIWRRKKERLRGTLGFIYALVFYTCLAVVIPFVVGRRTRIFLSAYGWLRRIDDIADGEGAPPKTETILTYCQERIDLFRAAVNRDLSSRKWRAEDLLLIHALRLSEKYGIDLQEEFEAILELILYDAMRRTEKILVSRKELMKYALQQDTSILSSVIKIFGHKEGFDQLLSTIPQLEGLFTRFDWLYDLPEDIPNGIVNIPQEAVQKYSIQTVCNQKGDFQLIQQSKEFQEWYRAEAAELMELWNSAGREFIDKYLQLFHSRLVERVIRSVLSPLLEKLLRTFRQAEQN